MSIFGITEMKAFLETNSDDEREKRRRRRKRKRAEEKEKKRAQELLVNKTKALNASSQMTPDPIVSASESDSSDEESSGTLSASESSPETSKVMVSEEPQPIQVVDATEILRSFNELRAPKKKSKPPAEPLPHLKV